MSHHETQISNVLSQTAAVTPGLDLAALASTFLQNVRALAPRLSRAALFRAAPDGTLIPLATSMDGAQNTPFHIIKELLRDTYRSKVTRVQNARTHTGARVIVAAALPTLVAPSYLIHAEFDALGLPETAVAVAAIEAAARFGAPFFDAVAHAERERERAASITRLIVSIVEAKDTYTSGHSERVADYSHALGKALGLPDEELEALRTSALWHDIGKIGVADAILKKPGLLSNDEFEEMKSHPLVGAEIVRHAPNSQAILAGVLYHHERFDGTGYPEGRSGEDIPLFARIIAVADAFDAMTSGRSYSGYIGQDEAVESLATKTDLFDPQILRVMVTAFSGGGFSMRTGTIIAGPAAA